MAEPGGRTSTVREALREILQRFDVGGPEIVGAHPQPNENAWLLGLVAMRQARLRTQRVMELVGARGVEPPGPITRIIVPGYVVRALQDVA